MAKKRRILVTGVARWWGALVVQRLVEDPDVAEVIGIDIREPRYDLGRADYLKLDIRHSLIGKLVRAVGIDTVVHTLTRVDSFDMDPARAHEMNVIGTLNLLAGCAGAGQPGPPLRPQVVGPRVRFAVRPADRASARTTASTPTRATSSCATSSRSSPTSATSPCATRTSTILALRFSNSLNPDEPQPLARYLDLEVVPTVVGYDPALQLIHRDDCVEAMVLATKRGPAGAYNIATARQRAALDAPRFMPASCTRRCCLRSASSWPRSRSARRAWRSCRRSCSTSCAGAARCRRPRPHASSASAPPATRAPRSRTSSSSAACSATQPDRHAYQYEKELEDFIHSRQVASPNGEGDLRRRARKPGTRLSLAPAPPSTTSTSPFT